MVFSYQGMGERLETQRKEEVVEDKVFPSKRAMYVLVGYAVGNKVAYSIRKLDRFKTDLMNPFIKIDSRGYSQMTLLHLPAQSLPR